MGAVCGKMLYPLDSQSVRDFLEKSKLVGFLLPEFQWPIGCAMSGDYRRGSKPPGIPQLRRIRGRGESAMAAQVLSSHPLATDFQEQDQETQQRANGSLCERLTKGSQRERFCHLCSLQGNPTPPFYLFRFLTKN